MPSPHRHQPPRLSLWPVAGAPQQVGLRQCYPLFLTPTVQSSRSTTRALVAPNDWGFIQDVIDLLSATLPRATLGSRVKT